MKIVEVDLDSLDRTEYICFIKSLINYYSVLFTGILELKIKGEDGKWEII